MTSNNHNEIANHEAQSREFLAKSRQYLAAGDLRQASEKGWGAATHIAKAVALSKNRQYTRPNQFHSLMNQASEATANPRPPHLPGRAEILPLNSHNPKSKPSHQEINPDIDAMAESPEILTSEPTITVPQLHRPLAFSSH